MRQPVLGHEHGDVGRLVRVAHRSGQRQRVDIRTRLVQRGIRRGRHGSAGVVPGALVVLDAHEVIVPRQGQPPAVHLGALAVPDRRIVAHDLVVDDRDAEPNRQPGTPGLDGVLGCPVAGCHAVGHGVHLLREHDVGDPVTRHAGLLTRGQQCRTLELAHRGRDVQPAQQPREVRLVQRHGPGHAVAQALGDDVAVAGEHRRCLRVEPPAAPREPVRRGHVVIRDRRSDPHGQAVVDDRAVVRESLRRELALGRLDPRPLDREPVGVQAQPGHEVDVLPPSLVAVAGLARRLPETVGRTCSRNHVSLDVLPPSV